MASLVNKTNAHTGGFLSSNEGPVGGCTGKGFGVNGCGIKMYHGLVGQSGGKKRRRSSKKKKRRRKKKRKTRKRKTKNKRRKRRHRGGATTNLLDPRAGLKAFATRGGNGSRGLSIAEKRTLRGGSTTHYRKSHPHNHHHDHHHRLVGGGVGYGMTAKNASIQANSGTPSGTGQGFHSTATTSVTGYKNCGLIPNFKLGAGRNFKGPADIQSGAGKSVSAYNQYNSAGYGYLKPTSKGNADIAGYHAPITSTSKSQRCGTGGKKKKRGGTRKRKAGSINVLLKPFELAYDGVSKTANNIGNTVHNASMLSDKAGGSSCSKRKRKKKNKKKKKKSKGKKRGRRGGRKTQKGGYAQYGSNIPLTRTLELPAGAQGGSWEGQLASPPTYTAGNFCQDNYNHFTGKGSPSPVLDQAAPAGKTMSLL